MKGVGAASRLFELEDRVPTISPTKGDMVRSARGTIEFRDVGFSYPTRPAVQIFEHLTFKIEQGSNVAIVEGPDLRTLVAGLNSIGLKADGIIAILQGIKSAGALQAELVLQ